MNFLSVATIMCIGLLIGVEVTVSAFLNPVVWKLDPAAQATAFRLFGRRLGRVMPVWYIASLLLLISETITHRHQSLVVLLGVAIALWGATIVGNTELCRILAFLVSLVLFSYRGDRYGASIRVPATAVE